MLETNEGRARKERFRLTRIFDDLARLGFKGSYDSVRRFAKHWRVARQSGIGEAFVPLSFAPGEAYQFDWSTEGITLAGISTDVKVAHFRLCYSRMPFLMAYPRETRDGF
jgi:transposase